MKKSAVFFMVAVFSTLAIRNIQTYAADAIGAPPAAYLTFLNVPEIHSTNITPFYKWTGMLKRMDAHPQPFQPWLDNAKILAGLTPRDMAQKVDDIINGYDYVADITNWGVADYWETPAEFFAHGGDCEDFAIAKYAWLRYLGVAEERLRIAIVYDRIRDLPHAVLILYLDNKAVILDSQVKEIRDSNATGRYRLIYSLNRLGWWYPNKPGDMRVSMIGDMKQPAGSGGGDIMQFSKECLAGSNLPECINAIEPAAR